MTNFTYKSCRKSSKVLDKDLEIDFDRDIEGHLTSRDMAVHGVRIRGKKQRFPLKFSELTFKWPWRNRIFNQNHSESSWPRIHSDWSWLETWFRIGSNCCLGLNQIRSDRFWTVFHQTRYKTFYMFVSKILEYILLKLNFFSISKPKVVYLHPFVSSLASLADSVERAIIEYSDRSLTVLWRRIIMAKNDKKKHLKHWNYDPAIKFELAGVVMNTIIKRKDLMKISKVVFHIKLVPYYLWWGCKKIFYTLLGYFLSSHTFVCYNIHIRITHFCFIDWDTAFWEFFPVMSNFYAHLVSLVIYIIKFYLWLFADQQEATNKRKRRRRVVPLQW